jgi:hypothetical protein
LSLKAIPTIDRTTLTRLKWHFCRLPAVVADHIEHLAWSTASTTHAHFTVVVVAFPASLGPASRASNRVHESTLAEEALLSSGKDEL